MGFLVSVVYQIFEFDVSSFRQKVDSGKEEQKL